MLVCLPCNSALDELKSVVAQEQSDIDDSSDSSNSDSDDANSSEEEECVKIAAEGLAKSSDGRRAARDAGDNIYQHRQTRTLHFLKRSNSVQLRLSCGRQVTDSFERLEYIPTFAWPHCKTCFGTKELDDHEASRSD
jgi:hypothetical protein